MTSQPTIDDLQAALQAQAALYGLDSPRLCPLLEEISDRHFVARRLDEAESSCKRAISLQKPGITAAYAEQLRRNLKRLAWIEFLRGRLDQAEANLRRIPKETGSHEEQTARNIEQTLAYFKLDLGDLGKAREKLLELVEMSPIPSDETDYSRGYYLLCLAVIHLADGDQSASRDTLETATKMIKDKCAVGYAVDYLSLAELVHLYLRQERLNEAVEIVKCTLLEEEDEDCPGNDIVGEAFHRLAEYFRGQGKHKQAESVYRRALSIYERTRGAGSYEYGEIAFSLAGMYLALKRTAEPEHLLKTSLRTRVREHGVNHPSVAAAIETYAAMLRQTNQTGLAQKLEHRAREIRVECVSRFNVAHPPKA